MPARSGPPPAKAGSSSSASSSSRAVSSARTIAVGHRKKMDDEMKEQRAALEEAQAATSAAKEQTEELDHALAASRDMEAVLAATLDSAGRSSVKLGSLHDWSTADAQQLLNEEEEADKRVDALLSRVRAGRDVGLGDLIGEQEALASRLAL